jgi:phosphoglycolate phosphatase
VHLAYGPLFSFGWGRFIPPSGSRKILDVHNTLPNMTEECGAQEGVRGVKTVIFDLDGTLADTSRDLIAAANTCFKDLGHGPLLDPVADKSIAFAGARAMLRLGFSRLSDVVEDAQIDAQYPRLLEAYDNEIDRHTTLYPGTMETIDILKSDGFGVGICTNKPSALAEKLMRRLGVRDAFGALVGADTLPVRKPDPTPFHETVRRLGGDPSRTCLVGDTKTDRETARAAGVASILVTFGQEDRAGIEALEPQAIIEHYSELPTVVSALVP